MDVFMRLPEEGSKQWANQSAHPGFVHSKSVGGGVFRSALGVDMVLEYGP